MILSLAVGSQLHSAPGQILAACAVTIGQCFIWPTLEALVSEGETPAGLPRAVGIYNIVWAVAAAAALFYRRHVDPDVRLQKHFLSAHRDCNSPNSR